MSSLPKFDPLPLLQISAPFDDPDFLCEVKFDGFRALAYVEDCDCELVSRKGQVHRRFVLGVWARPDFTACEIGAVSP